MTDVVRCPRCGTELSGFATFCADCDEYVADMEQDGGGGAGALPSRAAAADDNRLEDAIQQATKVALERYGFDVYDLSQGRKTRQTPGLADLYITGHGRLAWAEMKTATGDQSGAQKIFGERVRRNGGEYHVWRHEDEAAEWAREVIGS